ncbi:NFACT RNA binding domain-containing protein [Candidatus Pacearchaeota archaeon]|nr:NFACT RNA binding domain-containing protein [Candidatus Pacearchaeota archaeon]
MEFKDYQKYRWFYTSHGNLVIGGKSAMQNDELLSRAQSLKKDFIVMHTQDPGSPFSIILAPVAKVSQEEYEECAIFTGCFSRAWRAGNKTASIHIFKLSQLAKDSKMKSGTWGVIGPIKKTTVDLRLILTNQKGVLRAVPDITLKDKKAGLLVLSPGKISKQDMPLKIELELDTPYSQEEVLSALPTGGFRILR